MYLVPYSCTFACITWQVDAVIVSRNDREGHNLRLQLVRDLEAYDEEAKHRAVEIKAFNDQRNEFVDQMHTAKEERGCAVREMSRTVIASKLQDKDDAVTEEGTRPMLAIVCEGERERGHSCCN
jgi:hypothetical protein